LEAGNPDRSGSGPISSRKTVRIPRGG